MARKRRTQGQKVIEFLLEQGFKPVTEKEKREAWYKVARAPIDCPVEKFNAKEGRKVKPRSGSDPL